MNKHQLLQEFRLLWGIAPEGTLKYKKGKHIEQFMLGAFKEIEEETIREVVVIGQKRREIIGDDQFNLKEKDIYNHILKELKGQNEKE